MFAAKQRWSFVKTASCRKNKRSIDGLTGLSLHGGRPVARSSIASCGKSPNLSKGLLDKNKT
jgi:hypothetical protein